MKSFNDLYNLILDRIKNKPKDSYVAKITDEDDGRILQKVGEELWELSVEVSKEKRDKNSLISESTDLFFHFWILLAKLEITPDDLLSELKKRHYQKLNNN